MTVLYIRRPAPLDPHDFLLPLGREDAALETPRGVLRVRAVADHEVLVYPSWSPCGTHRDDAPITVRGQAILGAVFLVREHADAPWTLGHPQHSHLHTYSAKDSFQVCSTSALYTVLAAAILAVSVWAVGREAEFRAAHLDRLAMRCLVAEEALHDLNARQTAVSDARAAFESAMPSTPARRGRLTGDALRARATFEQALRVA